MLLSISTTHQPATDLGYLLGKHPERCRASSSRTATRTSSIRRRPRSAAPRALLLDIDPIGLVRNHRGGPDDATLAQYVNDRPYVASSFMSVAIARVFGAAMAGNAKERPELAAVAIPLDVEIAAVPCRGGEGFLRSLFEPLGYEVSAERHRARRAVSRNGARAAICASSCGAPRGSPSCSAPLRADPGARRREALLGRRDGGREAARPRRGLARDASRSAS